MPIGGNRSGPTLKAFQWEKKAKAAAKELDALAKAAKNAAKAEKKGKAKAAAAARGRTFGGAFGAASGFDKAKKLGPAGTAGGAIGGLAAKFGPAALAAGGLAIAGGVAAIGVGFANAAGGAAARGGDASAGASRFGDQLIAKLPFGLGEAASKRERVQEGSIGDINAVTDALARANFATTGDELTRLTTLKRDENKRVQNQRDRNRNEVELQGESETFLGRALHTKINDAGFQGMK